MTHRAQVPTAAADYFGRFGITDHPIIRQEFNGRRWYTPTAYAKRISGAWARKLRDAGVTHIQLAAGGHLADFTTTELSRKATAR